MTYYFNPKLKIFKPVFKFDFHQTCNLNRAAIELQI